MKNFPSLALVLWYLHFYFDSYETEEPRTQNTFYQFSRFQTKKDECTLFSHRILIKLIIISWFVTQMITIYKLPPNNGFFMYQRCKQAYPQVSKYRIYLKKVLLLSVLRQGSQGSTFEGCTCSMSSGTGAALGYPLASPI